MLGPFFRQLIFLVTTCLSFSECFNDSVQLDKAFFGASLVFCLGAMGWMLWPSPTPPAVPAEKGHPKEPASWVKTTSEEYHCSVMAPVPLQRKLSKDWIEYFAVLPGVNFQLSCAMSPVRLQGDPDAIQKAIGLIREGFTDNPDITIISTRPVRQGTAQGEEIKFQISMQGVMEYGSSRILIDGEMMYTVQVCALPSAFSDEDQQRFLNSFEALGFNH
jgi:hypothetical protein